jgi:hypothetical protein
MNEKTQHYNGSGGQPASKNDTMRARAMLGAGMNKKGKAWQGIINEMLSAHDVNVEYTYKEPCGNRGGYRTRKKIINIDAGPKVSIRHLLTAKAVEMVVKQDKLGALTDLLDRDLGKPIQAIDHLTGGEPFNVDADEMNNMLLKLLKKVVGK